MIEGAEDGEHLGGIDQLIEALHGPQQVGEELVEGQLLDPLNEPLDRCRRFGQAIGIVGISGTSPSPPTSLTGVAGWKLSCTDNWPVTRLWSCNWALRPRSIRDLRKASPSLGLPPTPTSLTRPGSMSMNTGTRNSPCRGRYCTWMSRTAPILTPWKFTGGAHAQPLHRVFEVQHRGPLFGQEPAPPEQQHPDDDQRHRATTKPPITAGFARCRMTPLLSPGQSRASRYPVISPLTRPGRETHGPWDPGRSRAGPRWVVLSYVVF